MELAKSKHFEDILAAAVGTLEDQKHREKAAVMPPWRRSQGRRGRAGRIRCIFVPFILMSETVCNYFPTLMRHPWTTLMGDGWDGSEAWAGRGGARFVVYEIWSLEVEL